MINKITLKKQSKNWLFIIFFAVIFQSTSTYTNEAQALQELRILLDTVQAPIILAVGVINNGLAIGLSKSWANITPVMIRTRNMAHIIKTLLPRLQQTVKTINKQLDNLKIEDSKAREANQEGINTIHALGYGIDALESIVPLLRDISMQNGILTEIAFWLKDIAEFAAPFELTNEKNNGKTPLRDQLFAVAETLFSINDLLRIKIIPQIEKTLPEMKKTFATMFGKST